MKGAAIEIGFLFVGGAHQVLHTAPVAVELSRDRRFRITCLVAGDAERGVVEQVARCWPDARLNIEGLPAPRWGQWLARFVPSLASLKVPRLFHNRHRLSQPIALVTPERTSTVLRRFGLTPAALLHIPHGSGDRARGFEPRLRLFDYVIVSGPKDAARMIGAGVVAPWNCAVSGSVKMAAIERMRGESPRLFANDRPVVLYNPHFSAELGSWVPWGRKIIAAFAAQDEFNLIVAPHVRLFESCSEAEKDALRSLGIRDRIIVDPGSARSHDSTYTQLADIYLGDVSSQVYEFLSAPRPCVFLNATRVEWQDNPDYACWRFGEVVDAWTDVMSAVRRARAQHAGFLPLQREGIAEALGDDWAGAPGRAAGLIRDFLLRERPELQDDFALPAVASEMLPNATSANR